MGGLLAGIILFLTVITALVLGILAAYGTVAGIIYLFARQSGRTMTVSAALSPTKALGAAAGQTSGN